VLERRDGDQWRCLDCTRLRSAWGELGAGSNSGLLGSDITQGIVDHGCVDRRELQSAYRAWIGAIIGADARWIGAQRQRARCEGQIDHH
jgi:hypothetical protein